MTWSGPRSLAKAIPAVIAPALARRGRTLAVLLSQWEAIVGPELAQVSQPLRLSGGARGPAANVLVVQVASAAATELLHRSPQVIERANGCLGVPAIGRLRLVHGTPVPRRLPPPLPLPDATTRAAMAAAVAEIQSPELRAALARFGGTLTALADRAARHV